MSLSKYKIKCGRGTLIVSVILANDWSTSWLWKVSAN